jgi:hypothetical protein
MHVILALRRLKQEEHEFEASLASEQDAVSKSKTNKTKAS